MGVSFLNVKKPKNMHVMYKNLHILGSLFLFLIVVKHPLL